MSNETKLLGAPASRGRRHGQDSTEQDDLLRRLLADAVRRMLEEGLREAPDRVAYLRAAAGEVGQVLALLAEARPTDGAELRAILAEQVVAVARELMQGLQN
jgi:DNA-directed RNA polymerase subunit F